MIERCENIKATSNCYIKKKAKFEMLMSSYTGFISPVKIIEKHMAGPSTLGGPGIHGPPTFLQGNEIFNYHFCSFDRSSILDPPLLIPCRRPS